MAKSQKIYRVAERVTIKTEMKIIIKNKPKKLDNNNIINQTMLKMKKR